MPNWCTNYLQITANKELMTRLQEKAKGPAYIGYDVEIVDFSFVPFITLPDDYYEGENWYEYNKELIGCKWFPKISWIDATEEELKITFETPWCDATAGVEAIQNWLLENRNAGHFAITYSYEELGAGFCGLYRSGCGNGSEFYSEQQQGDTVYISLDDIELNADSSDFAESSLGEINELIEDHGLTKEYLLYKCINCDGGIGLYPEFYKPYADMEQ